MNHARIFAAKIVVAWLLPMGFWNDRAEAAIYPIASSLNLHIEANAGAGLVSDDNGMAQTTDLNPLSASALAPAVNGTLTATAESIATATWISAGAGQFTIDTRFTTDDLSSIYDARVATGSPGWSYTFSSDQPAVLTLNYNIAYNGNYAYSTLLFLNQTMGGSLIHQVQFGVPPVTGALSLAINPNVNCALQIFDDSNLNQDLSALTSEMTGTFSFQITPVPEPGGLMVPGAALGAIGVLCRRRYCLRAPDPETNP